jgi:photosystem II stability/assembly factor-like uncharacterized protein
MQRVEHVVRRYGWRAATGGLVPLLVAVVLCGAAARAATSPAWQTLGPNDGSVVLSMVRDPHAQAVVYAGTSSGQVLRLPAETGGLVGGKGIPAGAPVAALAPDPDHPGTVYAGTSRGIYVTTDYGDTWQARGQGLPEFDSIEALALVPAAHGSPTLYAGTQQHGVYVSRDDGATWKVDSAGLPAGGNVYALTFDQTSGSVYVGFTGGPGVYALASGASTWSSRSSGLPAHADVFAILPLASAGGSSSSSETLCAGTSHGLYASADGGQSWHAAGLSQTRVLALAADPSHTPALYAGTDDDVYRSTDGGQTWTPVAASLKHQVAAVALAADAQGHLVVFAGAGPVVRFPAAPAPAGQLLSIAISIVVFLLLVGVLIYYYRRNRRYMRRHYYPPTPRSGSGAPPGQTRADEPRSRRPSLDDTGRAQQNGRASSRWPQPRP